MHCQNYVYDKGKWYLLIAGRPKRSLASCAWTSLPVPSQLLAGHPGRIISPCNRILWPCYSLYAFPSLPAILHTLCWILELGNRLYLRFWPLGQIHQLRTDLSISETSINTRVPSAQPTEILKWKFFCRCCSAHQLNPVDGSVPRILTPPVSIYHDDVCSNYHTAPQHHGCHVSGVPF